MKVSIFIAATFSAAAMASAIPNADADAAPEVDHLQKRECYWSGCDQGCNAGYTVKNIIYCNARFGIVKRECCL
ncbi:hypothetical protein FPQ18DRAFT_414025 [Pyronema domesticum]|nr:hypothetical protein FPQ18DRAFT_414025 [Pyronema domesticum]